MPRLFAGQTSLQCRESMPGSAGVGFTPHVVHVAIGEDISAKVIALSQVHARALCVLSGFGSVSAVTLGQPSSSGGTVQYEGHFEILSLSGSLLPTDNGSIRDRAGGISVMLSSPEGRVFGGRVAGQLIASAPTKVMVGTFLWGRLNAKNKKKESLEDAEGAVESVHQGAHNPGALNSISPNQNLTPTSSLSPWSAASRPMDMRNSHDDIDLMRG